jgi:hypothetical protein
VLVEGVAATVFALGPSSDHALLDELTGLHPDVTGVGDCLTPRTVEEAVLEGLRAAWNL